MWNYTYTDELYHHGIKGMKWGVRRYQKKDGSLTPAGKKRYKPYAVDGDGMYTKSKGAPKYDLPKGKSSRIVERIKELNDILSTKKDVRKSKTVNDGESFIEHLLNYHTVDHGKSKMTKRDERILREQGKNPEEYEKIITIAGEEYVKKNDKRPNVIY